MDTASLSGCRILLIDDDADNRDLFTFVLETSQAEVTAVGSADEVMVALSHQPFDVFISDIAMADQDGYSLLRRVRTLKHGKQIPTMTAFARDEDRQQAIEAGFQTCLVKPIDPDQVVSAVVNIMQR